MPSLTLKVHLDGEAFPRRARLGKGLEPWLAKADTYPLCKFTRVRHGRSDARLARLWGGRGRCTEPGHGGDAGDPGCDRGASIVSRALGRLMGQRGKDRRNRALGSLNKTLSCQEAGGDPCPALRVPVQSGVCSRTRGSHRTPPVPPEV